MDTSKLLERYDFRRVEIPADHLEMHFDPAGVEEDLQKLAVRFQTIEEVHDGVRTGDIVLIELPAVDGREAETIHVNVGKHYYDGAWEEALLGRTAGERVALAPADGGRQGTIRAYFRKIITGPTDEMVRRLEIPEVDTLDGYRRYMEDKHLRHDLKNHCEKVAVQVMVKVLEKSTFGDLTEEIRVGVEELCASARKQAESEGVTYGDILQRMVPECDSQEKAEAYLFDRQERAIKAALLDRSVAAEDNMPFNRENYEKKLARKRAEGGGREVSYEDYLWQSCYLYHLEKVKRWVLPQIKVIRDSDATVIAIEGDK